MKIGLEDKKKGAAAVPLTAAQQAAAAAQQSAAAPQAKAAAGKQAAASTPPAASASPAEPEDKAAAKARAKQEKAEAKARAKAEKTERKKTGKTDRRKVASGGIKELLVRHAEKGLVGLGAIALLLLVWSSVGRLTLPDPPNQSSDDLLMKVNGIKERIKSARFPDGLFPPQDYGPALHRNESRASADQFTNVGPWDRTLLPKQKRDEPVLYPVEEPVALAGCEPIYVQIRRGQRPPAAVAAGPHPPGGMHAPGPHLPHAAGIPQHLPDDFQLDGVRLPPQNPKNPMQVATEGRHFVAVDGLLPVDRQQKEYDHQFANAFSHDPKRDKPLYVEVRYRRMEVPPGAREDQLSWDTWPKELKKELDWDKQIAEYNSERQTWALVSPEIVPTEFIHDDSSRLEQADARSLGVGLMAKWLAPLVNQSWRPWANHPKLQALLIAESTPDSAAPEGSEQEKPEPAPAADAAGPMVGDAFKAKDAEAAKPKADAASGMETTPFGPIVVEKHGATDEAPKIKKAAPSRKNRSAASGGRLGDYQLVRVFDFTVEPGKRYCYELQLAIRNPNYDAKIPARDLVHPEAREGANKKFRFTDWSKPTRVVTVPTGDAMLADSIVEPTSDLPEQMAKVIVKVLDYDLGQDSAAEMKLRRGALASGDVTRYTLDAVARIVYQRAHFTLHTDLVLADIHGGGKITPGLAEPGEMLFVDSTGRLVGHDTVEDEVPIGAFHRLVHLFDAPPAPPPGTGGTGMGPDIFHPATPPTPPPRTRTTTPPRTTSPHKTRPAP